MLEFHPHASGSSGNFYTVTDGPHSIAIECGIRFKDIQVATGFKVSALDGVLVSHAHGDHCRSAVEMAKAGVDVYASIETLRALPAVPQHRAYGLKALEERAIGAWIVKPFDLVHDFPGTLGFLIGGPSGKRLAYVSDTAYLPNLLGECHILCVEANWSEEIARRNAEDGRIDTSRYKRTVSTHLSLERLLDMLAANDLSRVEQVYLLHLSAENSHEAEFKARVERATGIPTYVCAERSTGVLS